MKRVIFIKNAVILTATALLLRLAGIVFKVWLAAKIGSEGIGLYQLTLSFYVFISAFATGGICTAVTRISADSFARGSTKGAFSAINKGIALSLLLSLLSILLVFFNADFLASRLLGDARAAESLKILPLTLPFMSVCSCIRGYFYARRKTLSSSTTQLLEQAVRIGAVLILAGSFSSRGAAFASAAVFLGDAAAEAVSALVLYITYRRDRRKIGITGVSSPKTGREIIRIALPITSGRYLNSGLRAAENILVPKGLSAFGAAEALSQFGMIKGMALPLLFFPSSFLNAVSTLLIPEMSEAAAREQGYKIKYAAEKVLTLTSAFSYISAALFLFFGREIGLLIYKSEAVGFLLRALSPIVPFMYLDSVADGMLKGLDKQRFLFRITVSDSAARLLLVPFIVPRYGMAGFLFIMILSNVYTAAFRVGALLKCGRLRFSFSRWFIKPAVCAAIAAGLSRLLLPLFPFAVGTILSVLLAVIIYIPLIFITGLISLDDLRDIL